jgi:acetate kinase
VPVILTLNAGSSSLRYALWEAGPGERQLHQGSFEEVGGPAVADHSVAVALALDDVAGRAGAPDAVGHRVVQGGPRHHAPARVDAALVADLEALVPLAPLHLPAQLGGIGAAAERLPGVPQVACFDTAFHAGMPEDARRLPLPEALWERGVRRYGFHGLSYEFVLRVLGPDARGRLVIAHLGNGASLAAVRDGAPVDTTMGLTPAGGLMMGTRTGDIDPGVLVTLAREPGHDPEALDRLVNREAGLRGVSGGTSDMRELLAARGADPRAARAVRMFALSARKHVGAMAAALGGIDTLVFTGGIGEHAAPVRAEICDGLGHLGVTLDPERNARGEGLLSPDGAACAVRVVATDEDRMIARHTAALVAPGARPR